MKIISTSKNLKIELYNEDKLIYDNFKIFSVSDLGVRVSSTPLYLRLNHILEQNLQKRQNIQNLKICLFLLILSIFQNQKKLNLE
jgi:hypothetical protein